MGPCSHEWHQKDQTRIPVPFDLCAFSFVTQVCGWPVITLLCGISSPEEEPQPSLWSPPRLESLPVWLPRLLQVSAPWLVCRCSSWWRTSNTSWTSAWMSWIGWMRRHGELPGPRWQPPACSPVFVQKVVSVISVLIWSMHSMEAID